MDRTDIESNKEKYVTVGCNCGMTKNKRFDSIYYDKFCRVITDDGKEITPLEVVDLLNEQEETIERLKTIRGEQIETILKLKEKIKELETRNQRQYERLKEITDLMMERDWKSLEKMVEDWEQTEKQLEREWSTYGE